MAPNNNSKKRKTPSRVSFSAPDAQATLMAEGPSTPPPRQPEEDITSLMANLRTPSGRPEKRIREEKSPSPETYELPAKKPTRAEEKIDQGLQRSIAHLTAQTEAVKAFMSAINTVAAGLQGLAKTKGFEIAHRLQRELRNGLRPDSPKPRDGPHAGQQPRSYAEVAAQPAGILSDCAGVKLWNDDDA